LPKGKHQAPPGEPRPPRIHPAVTDTVCPTIHDTLPGLARSRSTPLWGVRGGPWDWLPYDSRPPLVGYDKTTGRYAWPGLQHPKAKPQNSASGVRSDRGRPFTVLDDMTSPLSRVPACELPPTFAPKGSGPTWSPKGLDDDPRLSLPRRRWKKLPQQVPLRRTLSLFREDAGIEPFPRLRSP